MNWLNESLSMNVFRMRGMAFIPNNNRKWCHVLLTEWTCQDVMFKKETHWPHLTILMFLKSRLTHIYWCWNLDLVRSWVIYLRNKVNGLPKCFFKIVKLRERQFTCRKFIELAPPSSLLSKANLWRKCFEQIEKEFPLKGRIGLIEFAFIGFSAIWPEFAPSKNKMKWIKTWYYYTAWVSAGQGSLLW
jgi:hypothetical protein